jgi:hypothetical protein
MSVGGAFAASGSALAAHFGELRTFVLPGEGPRVDRETGEAIPATPPTLQAAHAIPVRAEAGQYEGIKAGSELLEVDAAPFVPYGRMFPKLRPADGGPGELVDIVETRKVSGVPTLYLIRLRRVGDSPGP